MVCVPFIELKVDDYFEMIKNIVDKYKDYLKKNKESGNLEQLPYV